MCQHMGLCPGLTLSIEHHKPMVVVVVVEKSLSLSPRRWWFLVDRSGSPILEAASFSLQLSPVASIKS